MYLGAAPGVGKTYAMLGEAHRRAERGTDVVILVTVVVALIGGLVSALIAAVAGSILLNFFFTPPLRTLTIGETNNSLALLWFVLVATLVSSVVDLAARRTRQAARAAA